MQGSKTSFYLQRSYYLLAFLLVLHGFAMACVWLAAIPFIYHIIFMAVLCLSLVYYLWRYGYHATRIRVLRPLASGDWQLGDDETRIACLQPTSLITRYVVILNFKLVDQRQAITIIILPDSLPKLAFKQLRVLLNQ